MKQFFLSIITLCLFYSAQSQSWTITGNAGTNPSIHFLGTTDNMPLRFRINNTYAGELDYNYGKTTFGYGAGQGNTGFRSVAIGYLASYTNPAYESTAVGAYALYSSYGGYNCAFGYGAMQLNTSGNSNTAMGYGTLARNSVGYDNVAMGRDALRNNNGGYGSRNTAIGSKTLDFTTNSQYNTAVGYSAGLLYDLGWNNTILGANCGGSFAGQYNMVAIGQGVICPDNSTVRIGNSATWSIGGYAGWSNFSDGRYKKDVQENVVGLDFIMKLRPVTYHLDITGVSKKSHENGGEEWNEQMKTAIAEKEKMLFTGFVAQEVEQAAKQAGFDFSGVDKPRTENGFYGLRYSDFVVPLVKSVQEQQLMIDELRKQNTELQKRLTDLERKLGISTASNNALTVRPNPSINKVLLDITADNPSRAMIKIFDSKGALVKQQQVNVMQGGNQVSVDIQNLAKGTYLVSAEWENGQVKRSGKMVKE